MLMQLNNKQHKLASMMLSLFVGSWLLLLCQACFAYTEDVVQQESSADISSPCHEVANESQSEIINADNEHCLGACDCDALTVTVQSEKNTELKENNQFKKDVSVVISPKIVLSNRAPPGYLYSTLPERDKKPPFYTYNVLLI